MIKHVGLGWTEANHQWSKYLLVSKSNTIGYLIHGKKMNALINAWCSGDLKHQSELKCFQSLRLMRWRKKARCSSRCRRQVPEERQAVGILVGGVRRKSIDRKRIRGSY